jgi:hypothetical protein
METDMAKHPDAIISVCLSTPQNLASPKKPALADLFDCAEAEIPLRAPPGFSAFFGWIAS